MVLYMVECRFSDPVREQAWNDWYSGERLDELLSVPGFVGSQRHRALGRSPARYLAVHQIDGMEVFDSLAYQAIGGGGFLGYQDCITDWVRRFFKGTGDLARTAPDEVLLLTDAPAEQVTGCGAEFAWIREVNTGARRGLARVGPAQARELVGQGIWPIDAYVPLIAWRPGTGGTLG